eukprot:76462_1
MSSNRNAKRTKYCSSRKRSSKSHGTTRMEMRYNTNPNNENTNHDINKNNNNHHHHNSYHHHHHHNRYHDHDDHQKEEDSSSSEAIPSSYNGAIFSRSNGGLNISLNASPIKTLTTNKPKSQSKPAFNTIDISTDYNKYNNDKKNKNKIKIKI